VKKILFVVDSLGGGGKERQLLEIIKVLSKDAGLRLGVITFNKNKHYSTSIKALVHFYKELKKRPTRLEPFFTIWKQIRQFDPDIIHTWDSLSSMYCWLPICFYNIRFVDGSIRDAGIEKGFQKWVKKFFLKRAEVAIANSRAGLKYYDVNGTVLHNAIDLNRFHEKRGDEIGVNIIMVANFSDYKDHETFIKSSITLLQYGIVDGVFLIGDGKNKNKFEDFVASTCKTFIGKFHFLGSITHVEDYLEKCQYGILCSTCEYAEGISNSVLEYMAAGLIPIATNVGGMSELIEDQKNGFLIDCGESHRIAEIITNLERDPAQKQIIIAKARKTVEEEFSLEATINTLLNLYNKLC